MIRKFVAEPSDKMNGLYDVTKFNEEKQVYIPFERDVIKSVAENRAKYLNDEYIFEEIRNNYANHPKDKHFFVDNSNPNHFYSLLNINKEWNDVLLIEFYGKEVESILHGSDINVERGIISSFCANLLFTEKPTHTEYCLEEIFPESAPDIDSKIKEIVDKINHK